MRDVRERLLARVLHTSREARAERTNAQTNPPCVYGELFAAIHADRCMHARAGQCRFLLHRRRRATTRCRLRLIRSRVRKRTAPRDAAVPLIELASSTSASISAREHTHRHTNKATRRCVTRLRCSCTRVHSHAHTHALASVRELATSTLQEETRYN